MSQPAPTRRVGRTVAIGAIAAVVALLILPSLIGGSDATTGPVSSTYSTEPDGAAAYAELLGRAGHEVHRLRDPLSTATLDPGSTVVVLDPAGTLRDDALALRRFVEAGGRLVAGGPGSVSWLRELVATPPTYTGSGTRTGRVAAPVPEVRGVRRVQSAGDGSFSDAGDTLPAVATDAGTLVSVADVGAGRVVLLADASPLQNRLLARDDNAALGLAIAGDAGRPVVFAESLHGYGPASGIGAIPNSWRWALAGLVVAALVLALARGRRLGPPERAARELPPPRREYAESLGRVLARTSDRGEAVATLQEHARRQLRGMCGPDAPDAILRAAATRAGVEEAEADALLDPAAGRRDPLAAGRGYARLTAAARREGGTG